MFIRYDQPLNLKTLRAMPDIVRERVRDATKFVQLNPEAKRWDAEMERKVRGSFLYSTSMF